MPYVALCIGKWPTETVFSFLLSTRMRPSLAGNLLVYGGVEWRGCPLIIRVRAMPINILIIFKHKELIYDIEKSSLWYANSGQRGSF